MKHKETFSKVKELLELNNVRTCGYIKRGLVLTIFTNLDYLYVNIAESLDKQVVRFLLKNIEGYLMFLSKNRTT